MNFIIRNPYYKNASFFYIFCSDFIFQACICFIMLRAVNFNSKFSFAAIEIDYVIIYNFLSEKSYRITTQIIIPKMFLFLCHIFS